MISLSLTNLTAGSVSAALLLLLIIALRTSGAASLSRRLTGGASILLLVVAPSLFVRTNLRGGLGGGATVVSDFEGFKFSAEIGGGALGVLLSIPLAKS